MFWLWGQVFGIQALVRKALLNRRDIFSVGMAHVSQNILGRRLDALRPLLFSKGVHVGDRGGLGGRCRRVSLEALSSLWAAVRTLKGLKWGAHPGNLKNRVGI